MKETKKENRGGKRPGSGRKKKDDPKIQINLWVNKSKIAKIGSMEETQNVCYCAIDEECSSS